MGKNVKLQRDRQRKHQQVQDDPDYINAPSYNNSLQQVIKRHPEGVPDAAIGKYLLLTPEQVQEIFVEACAKLRSRLQD